MVEVLKRGTGTREAECENCGSTLRYMPSEVTYETRGAVAYANDPGDSVPVIKCPECGAMTNIHYNKRR